MSIRSEWYELYKDKYGLVQNTKTGSTSGNGLLYTAEYLIGAKEAGEPHEDLKHVYYACQKEVGLLNRAPNGEFGQNSIDDYTGAAAASMLVDGGYLARNILKYGRGNKAWGLVPYVYNNVEPGKWTGSAWLGRFPQLICAWKWAAGEKPKWWERLAFTVSMLLPKKGEDGWSLSFIMAYIAQNRVRDPNPGLLEPFWEAIEAWAISRYRSEAKKAWESPGAVRATNFGDMKHPSIKYLASWDVI